MSRDNTVDALLQVKEKIQQSGVRLGTIISRCEEIDRNKDDVIHTDDLENVLRSTLKEHMLSRRELIYLYKSISNENIVNKGGQINYRKLYDVLGATNEYTHKSTRHVDVEHWIDDVPASKNPSEKWATMPGSVGEWLFKAACPSEIANFKRFISCLERFERESGMKIQLTPGGNFKVPLGPDLQASIKFNMG